MHEAVGLAHRLKVKDHVRALEQICDRFKTEKPTFELLRDEVDGVMGQTAALISERVEDEMGDPLPGKEALSDERDRIWADFVRLLYPPEWSEIDIRKFRGAKTVEQSVASFKGDAGGVQPIVEGSIALIRQYSDLIGAGDFNGAYQLTDVGLQAYMSKKEFVAEHERAARKYGGPALEFELKQFAYIFADELVRKDSNTSKEGWPKLTAKENRRCRVIGFWIRNRTTKTGCAGALWIAEEQRCYRVAKFTFYVP